MCYVPVREPFFTLLKFQNCSSTTIKRPNPARNRHVPFKFDTKRRYTLECGGSPGCSNLSIARPPKPLSVQFSRDSVTDIHIPLDQPGWSAWATRPGPQVCACPNKRSLFSQLPPRFTLLDVNYFIHDVCLDNETKGCTEGIRRQHPA